MYEVWVIYLHSQKLSVIHHSTRSAFSIWTFIDITVLSYSLAKLELDNVLVILPVLPKVTSHHSTGICAFFTLSC